jgi:hypothetical protein
VWGTRASKFVLVAGTLILLGACQMVGPIAIDQGRDRYNHIIESTSKEQTFANILRVYHHEPTLFMDVTEVDATTTFSGAASGAVTNIGAKAGTSGGTLAGQTGSAAGGVTYSESPLIRYQPLLGQSLVAQLATPVGPDALASLHDSYWGVAPLLDFAASFLTLDYDNLYAAMNVIAELDYDDALELVAEKSEATKSKDQTTKQPVGGNVTLEVTNKSASTGGTDALVLYYLPDHAHESRRDRELWHRLQRIYANTQLPPDCQKTDSSGAAPGQAPNAPAPSAPVQAPSAPVQTPSAPVQAPSAIAKTVGTSDHSQNCPSYPPSNSIELRTMPVPPLTVAKAKPRLRSGAPLMKTYSALGILKNAAEQPHPRIGFVTSELYRTIRGHAWNDPHNQDHYLTFYTLLSGEENDGDERPLKPREREEDQKINDEVDAWLGNIKDNVDIPFVYEPRNGDVYGDDYIEGNLKLGYLRRYILIIRGENPPANAYVAHFDHGEWYYIDGNDEISQKNFELISLFMTMMAVPSGTPALAPSISVGGGT